MASKDRARRTAVIIALVLAALALGFMAGERAAEPPAKPRSELQLADTSTVLVAVRGLARLESVSYHMERIIDLKQRQQRLFGLIEADDAILLVAAGDVVAGVDLAKLTEQDVTIEPESASVRLRLPAPEILWARLDDELTYVHSRRTDVLAKPSAALEGEARRLAQASIREAALGAGILERARQSAEHTLSALIRSLGYREVTFERSAE